ncbi:Gfo/Idh/MocA family protein [Yoonia vestfoldensis]|jgi:predicted dehydrogenase|uniref:1,5-anhydro-D-fructose reductase n=1 Tax=Yoonia vestfoldensis TaxID=245188 RepID=A0A1Y0EEU9_9RHOB|nr:Gfo/Idh/MocA family oxidoreductase [Yoonia vestfoldensis]ARU01901.1 1,5-anhydro-D-fructose reductase [Yoonia vestfoldensis]
MTLKLGMVGGGRGAFIGGVHRIAARLDGHWELVAGAFSSDPKRAATSAAELGIAAERSYGSFVEMAKAEAARPDCIDAVAIVTPNHLHVPVATAFLRAGIPVICDKPLATTVKDAEALVLLVAETGIPFILTQTYTGYPMVREARALVAAGRIGHVRHVQVEYLQDWLAEPVERGGQKQASWRADPAQSGAGGCIADIGTHAFNLATFVSGLVAHALLADLTAFVPGRALDDNAALLLRFQGGAKGMIWASQVAPGTKNGLRLRVVGDAGGLMWDQEHPDDLEFTPIGQPTQTLRRGGEGVVTASRLPAGHPEGYLEAFATLYTEAAGMVRRFRERAKPDQATMLPTVTDGLAGMRFISAGVRSHEGGAVWINL